jgi:hypothetical protein
MLEMINKVIDNEKPWLFVDDTIESILHDLEHYTLDPSFEKYGNFVNHNPQWTKETNGQYNGCTYIFGNFYTYSHAFRLITDDENIINMIETAVIKNKQTEAYKQAKISIEEQEKEYQMQVLERINKLNNRA